MLSSGSTEKSSTALAENSSPTRGNFAVGMNSLGDENQQNIRIQLAVHRYNNSPGCSFIRPMNERSSSSVFKHGFLKSTQKYKNCDSDKEDVHNGLKKSLNQYQGIGNFPVVHLKKNAVIGKPIKRSTSNEFKIQLPELPFNRFLNHSPDICLDTKTSTRSVLDVLQDLSRKRIHTKDDTEASKRKCKGLGGDALLDFEAPYKPLFVPKNKINTVTYRDSMTQTQEMSQFDSTYSKKNDSPLNNDKNDPKAELRRKLARQNNEIFASLSSSTLTYPLKRNSEKISNGKDDTEQAEPKTKKTKYLSVENNGRNMQNGGLHSKELLTGRNSVDHLDRVDKKQKTVDSNKISPNKDRLTAIFLEMKNINPKVEVLAKNKALDEKENLQSPDTVNSNAEKGRTEKEKNHEQDKSSSNSGFPLSCQLSKAATNNASSPVDSNKISNGKVAGETSFFGLAGQSSVAVSKEVPISEKTSTALITTTTTSTFILPTSSNTNFGFLPETSSNFKVPVASTISSSLTQTPIFSTGIWPKANSEMNSLTAGNKVGGVQEKVQESSGVQSGFNNLTNQALIQTPSLGEGKNESQEVSLNQNTSNLFKFGTGGSLNQAFPSTQIQSSGNTSNEKDNAPKNALNQLSNNAGILNVPNVANSQTLTSGFPTSSSVTVNTITAAVASGTTTTSATATATITTTTTTTTTGATATTTAFTQDQQSTSPFTFTDKTPTAAGQGSEKSPTFPFSFGQTSTSSSMSPTLFGTGNNVTLTSGTTAAEGKSQSDDDVSQEKPKQINSTIFTQNNFPSNSFLSAAPSFEQNVGISSPQGNQSSVPFKFGEKTDNQNVKPNTETSVPSTNSNIFDPKPKSSVFSFGQKPAGQGEPQLPSTQTAVSQPSLFQSGVFTFGQKSSTPVTSSQITGSSGLFGQNTSAPTNLFQQNNVSQPNTTLSNPLLSSSSPFGMSSQANASENKNQIPSFIQTTSSSSISPMNNTFTQNKLSIPNFGASTSSFGQPASSSLSNEKNIFGSNTSQSAPSFGSGSAAQSSPFSQTFGDNSNKQQNNNAGSNFFMQSSTAQNSGFGQNSVFGSSSFGQNTTENNIFGQKTQIGGFEQNQTVQSSPFGQSSISQTFGSQTPFTFGVPSTTSTSSFPVNPSTASSVFTFGGSTKTTAASTSNFGFSSTSQPSSSSQSLFTFSGQGNNNTFKFGSSTGSATGSSSGTFSFDANPSGSEASKPATSVFSFGGSQTSTQNTGFNFGATPSPVFSFGEFPSPANTSSKFSFGGNQPNSGMFSSGVTPSPTMPLQAVFSIGTGSSQPRNRNTAVRARRRT